MPEKNLMYFIDYQTINPTVAKVTIPVWEIWSVSGKFFLAKRPENSSHGSGSF
jgi:hypothetical protein